MYTLDSIYEKLKSHDISMQLDYSHPIKTKGEKIKLSIGRIWFNLLTPDDYPIVDQPITKKDVSRIIEDIYKKYDSNIASDFVVRVNQESFKLGTIKPATFDIDALIVPDFIEKKKQALLSDKNIKPDEFNRLRYDLAVEYLNYIRDNYNSGVHDVLMSGAKGDPSDWALLMIAKGSMIDIEGNLSDPSSHSLDEGLTLEEFYLSAGEARFTQYQKSKGSSEPGYLASRTAFANSNIMITSDDCWTNHSMKITVTKSIANRIIGRYYKYRNDIKLIENPDDMIGKTIELRSPLYCQDPNGICKICYGTLAERLKTNKVGLLSSATINDQGINAAMKSRHKTSQVNLQKANFKKDIIR